MIATLFLALAAPIGAERPPNVVFFLADDLGWAELGCYGQTKIRTPRVDALAAEGLRFTRHYSGSPVCAPSRCVLLTGLHTGHAVVRDNWENGGWGEDAPEGQYPLPAGTLTVAALLRDAGYATAAVGKWGLGGPETSGHPNRQGFDLFVGYLCQRKAHNYYPTHLWRNEEKLPLDGNPWFPAHQELAEPLPTDAEYHERYAGETYACDPMLDAALEFVRANADRPFFLYYASPVPHAAIQVPPEELEAYPAEWDAGPYLGQQGYLPHPSPRRGYAAMVTRFDRDVGRVLDLLDELELADDTVVMFSSDNGATFNGGTDSAFFDSSAGLRGTKCTVFEGGIRVPLVVRWPGRVAPGTTDHVSAFQDFLPTVAELCGLPFRGETDGLSFAPTLLGRGDQPEHDHLYWEYKGRGQQAVLAGRWKGVRTGLNRALGPLALYDLEADPFEEHDVAAGHPDVVARLEALLSAARTPSDVYPIPALDE